MVQWSETKVMAKVMEIFTIAEWEENFDELLERVEKGESIGILREDGQAAVMMPYNEYQDAVETIQIYTDDNNEAS